MAFVGRLGVRAATSPSSLVMISLLGLSFLFTIVWSFSTGPQELFFWSQCRWHPFHYPIKWQQLRVCPSWSYRAVECVWHHCHCVWRHWQSRTLCRECARYCCYLLWFDSCLIVLTWNEGKIGSEVIVPYRGEESGWRHLKVMGDIGQISAIPFDIRQPETLVHVSIFPWKSLCFLFHLLIYFPTGDEAIQCGGEPFGKGLGYTQLHHEGSARRHRRQHRRRNMIPLLWSSNMTLSLSLTLQIARELGIQHFIHISALGAEENSNSMWNRTKVPLSCPVPSLSHVCAVFFCSSKASRPSARSSLGPPSSDPAPSSALMIGLRYPLLSLCIFLQKLISDLSLKSLYFHVCFWSLSSSTPRCLWPTRWDNGRSTLSSTPPAKSNPYMCSFSLTQFHFHTPSSSSSSNL